MMSSQTVAQVGPSSRGAKPDPTSTGQHPLLAGPLSGLLLWCSFPTANWGWLAWVALVPLFSLVKSPRSPRSIYLGAWAGGVLFWLLSISWVRLTDSDAWLAWIVMALALSVWWPGFLALTRLAVRQLKLPLMFAAPAVWVGLEFVRAHILTGFAWYYLGHTQHETLPIIQIADITGALGVSVLIALVNAWVAELWLVPLFVATANGPKIARSHWISGGIVVALLAFTVGYGLVRMTSAHFKDGPRLALLQSNIEQSLKMEKTAAPDLFAVYESLVSRSLKESPPPDLIVWPETSYPYHYTVRDPKLSATEFAKQAKKLAPKVHNPSEYWTDLEKQSSELLFQWVDQIRIPMLIGALVYDFHIDGPSKFNSAILFEPGVRTLQRYAKMHLVPFGEYVPLIDYLPWIKVLTPYHGETVPSLTYGTKPVGFTLGKYRYVTAICFEDTVPQAVRSFFASAPVAQAPDVLLNISNDGWFHGSAEHDMHLAISVFRAVEHRVPLARAVNTGISALIDGNGRVLASVGKSKEDVLTVTVPLDPRSSFYTAWGDWVGYLCLSATTILAMIGAVLNFQSWTAARSARFAALSVQGS